MSSSALGFATFAAQKRPSQQPLMTTSWQPIPVYSPSSCHPTLLNRSSSSGLSYLTGLNGVESIHFPLFPCQLRSAPELGPGTPPSHHLPPKFRNISLLSHFNSFLKSVKHSLLSLIRFFYIHSVYFVYFIVCFFFCTATFSVRKVPLSKM